ncbi:RHS repeat-associated core domain-containing protein [Stenotrophomonas sp. HMWF003]|uniref:RHS repeat protein n=1 Tax=Stenotrophomonas sp. HMWF003 TaxID=2056840 RepID=UPI00280B33AF|nr:RHS repeat-associated core domain-containing protein [Stenotrophomonas sp. HMWF003]
MAESDASGNVVKRFDYEPYGVVVGEKTRDGPGYAGHVSDSATGLSYMQQRYMDPQLGMFLSTGPVAAYQRPIEQFIQYRYTKGNPYKFTDPDGRQANTNSLPSIFPIPIPNRFPDGPLPTKPSGEPAPDPDAAGPHTQLGQRDGRNGKYDQAREFDGSGRPVKTIDFTDHGRPGNHTNPHEHPHEPSATGGTPSRGRARPLNGG